MTRAAAVRLVCRARLLAARQCMVGILGLNFVRFYSDVLQTLTMAGFVNDNLHVHLKIDILLKVTLISHFEQRAVSGHLNFIYMRWSMMA